MTSTWFGGWRPSRTRPRPDPTTSDDPTVRGLLQGLTVLAASPALTPATKFRADLRQQLVAVTPRLVSEAAVDAEPTPHRAASAWSRWRRPVMILVSTTAVFIALLGSAVYLSSRSLPGDTLYGVKRASEDVQLSLTSGDTARGRQYLSLAGTRADEVSSLLGHAGALGGGGVTAGAQINSQTAKLVASTLDTADSQTRSGADLLNTQAVRTTSTAPLNDVLNWAPGQQKRLQSIIDRIPAGSLHDRAAASLEVLDAALTRSTSLQPLLGSPCEASAPSDAYGPLPQANCTPTDSSASKVPGSPSSTAPSGHPVTPGASSRPAGSGGAPATTPGAPTATGGPSTGATLPGLPLPLPSPDLTSGPITTDTCGLGVNLPPIAASLGPCGISVGIGH